MAWNQTEWTSSTGEPHAAVTHPSESAGSDGDFVIDGRSLRSEQGPAAQHRGQARLPALAGLPNSLRGVKAALIY